MREKVLVVDDEAGVRASLAGILGDEGYAVDAVDSGEGALAALESRRYDLVLLDVWLPGADGLEVLARIRESDAELPVVVISGHGTIETAVKAVRLGAQDFVEKPLSLEKTLLAVRNALQRRRLETEVRDPQAAARRALRDGGRQPGPAPPARGDRPGGADERPRPHLRRERDRQGARRARHPRAAACGPSGPFVEVNCAAIPEELIESELFGHVKGAFTGALAARKGKFELADGGTLFLDEIGDMSLKTQAKVLRALQEQRIEPVGGAGSVEVDVRVIAATNKNLEEEIQKGRFREDLYFRLNVIPFQVPPLRERREDIPLLARHFMDVLSAEHGRRPRAIAPEALLALSQLPWPGNVRELRNIIERLVIMTPGDAIERRHLPASLLESLPAARPRRGGAAGAGVEAGTLAQAREDFERRYILRKYHECGGNMSRTAEALGVERSNLYRKMKGYGLLPARRDAPEADEA